MLRIGVVGYGTGGQHFHTPFIAAADDCTLAGIVARAEATIARARADWPNVPVFPSLTAMIAADVCNAVTVTTPPQTRRALVLEAIDAGLHVIADKPFAPSYEGGMELDAMAKKRGITLGVYQNRRFDADLQTLKKVIDDGRLGRLWRIHSRMDQDNPQTVEAGPSGGLLRDLGSHVVDQMVYLLGPVISVDAQLDIVDLAEGSTDVGFTISLQHEGGAHSHLSASKLNSIDARELRAYGDKGCYLSQSTDVQAQDIFAGVRPSDDPNSWGYEPQSNWGTLFTVTGPEIVPSEQGRYHDYYAAFAKSVSTGSSPPVSAETASRTLAILDAARRSAEGRQRISL